MMSSVPHEGLNDRVARLPSERRALIERLLKSRDTASPGTGLTAVPPRDRSKPVPLSYAQQRLWFLHQLGGEEPYYNIDYARRTAAPIDFVMLERAVNEVVRRHESLRTTFASADGEPVQVIAPELTIPLVRIDLSALPAMRRETEAARLALEEARQPFDLERGPLMRTKLVRLADNDHMLLMTMHHIVCDAWSMMVFAKEMTEIYLALAQGRTSPLPELPVQYADYAVWQRSWLESGVLDAQLAYWKKQLAGLPTLHLPTDRLRPPVQSYRGSSWYQHLPDDLAEAARALSQREGVTLFTTLLTAFLLLLHRHSGQDEVVIGAPVANRNRPETQGLIGFFVNTLLVRADIAGNRTARDLLHRVQATVSDAFAHQDAPFESLVEELQPQRDLSRNPLYQVSFQLYQHGAGAYGDQQLMRNRVHVDKGTAAVDLAFDLFDVPEGLIIRAEYSTDLFDKATVERMLGHFQVLLRGLSAGLDVAADDLDMLTAEERRQLLVTWNETAADYPRDACIHHLFTAQAARTPEAVAVVSADGDVTYRELDRKSDELAAHLQSLGVGPNVLVGICMERSADMIVALLGTLKAGGAYIPLDPAYPSERLSWLIADSQPRVVLTHPAVRHRIPATAAQVICLDEAWRRAAAGHAVLPSAVTAGDLAYVIYTSGSTGEPNGVLIEHRSACMQLAFMQQAFPLTPADRVVQKYSLSFDAALMEIFCPLAVGARVILAGRDQRVDPAELLRVMVQYEVTVLDLVPSLLEALVEAGGLSACRSLRRIVCGGEAMPPALPRRVLEQSTVELVNMYGPTEATVNATFWRCDPSVARDSIPIGRPCGNTQIYLLDERGHPVPVGVAGEIHIGGDGLARGYLNRPELTRRRFVADPFSPAPGARLFRTGDRARYLPNGDIEYLGRVDGQVKVSGFRIETGEIAAALAAHQGVRAAQVVARDGKDGRRRLTAYFVPQLGEPEIWPSLGEYFLYDELTYYAMTHDEARNRAYRQAISALVKGRTVVDIGTGADALWARWCVAEGARHVYAIEMLDHAHAQARRLIAKLGLADRITLLHGDSRDITLPERVDVSVSELIGTIGSSEGAVPILNDARRFLKAGGSTIPHRCITKIAAVALPEPMRSRPCFTGLTRSYADKIFQAAGAPFELRICLKNLPDSAIVSDAGDFETLVFDDEIELERPSTFGLTVTRAATIDGFLLWVNLFPSAGHFIDVMSGEHSWLPVFFPVFHPGLRVEKGDRIAGQSRAIDNGTLTPDYRVHGEVQHAGGGSTPFDYTSCHRKPAVEPGPFHRRLMAAAPAPQPTKPIQGVSGRQNLIAGLRDHLRRRLPEHMLPSAFVLMKALPLTPTGKVDPGGLPDPDSGQDERVAEFVSPRSQMEWAIAELWQELLGLARVGIHENFFDLGGHSLMILRLQSRMRERLGVDVSLNDLFQFPTVGTLAAALAGSAGAVADAGGSSAPAAVTSESAAGRRT
jgi:amino acid adenylation domain-containing protein